MTGRRVRASREWLETASDGKAMEGGPWKCGEDVDLTVKVMGYIT